MEGLYRYVNPTTLFLSGIVAILVLTWHRYQKTANLKDLRDSLLTEKSQGFPDYAALTGVPAPDPYVGFDIKRAIPRPYRPFRWKYHQTMGMNLAIK
jgi:hypothetical protein